MKIDLSWRIKTGNFTFQTQPTNMLANLLTSSMVVLSLAPPSIYSNSLLVRRIKSYEIYFCRKFGLTFLLLGRDRSTFCFLPSPPRPILLYYPSSSQSLIDSRTDESSIYWHESKSCIVVKNGRKRRREERNQWWWYWWWWWRCGFIGGKCW